MSAAPLSNAGGSLNDIGNSVARTITLPLFATTGFVGPTLGPLIGGYIASSHLGWRWCYWITAIWNGLAFVMTVVFMPETNTPALLKYKAVRYRKLTGDARWRAKIEDETLAEATKRSLKRPFVMLAVEPVVQFFVLYLTGTWSHSEGLQRHVWRSYRGVTVQGLTRPVVYVCLYGFFEAYPIVFSEHGLSLAQTGLMFIPIIVGFFVLLALVYLHYMRYKRLAADAAAGKNRMGIHEGKVEPEERLVPRESYRRMSLITHLAISVSCRGPVFYGY
jgi:DHA1 family multidrug resistance protein-like MFS transporter